LSDDDDPLAPDFEDDGQEPADGEPDNAADAKRIRRQERKIDRDKRESDEFWRGVFTSPVGRREMWAILKAGFFKEERFGAGPNGFPHPEATWFRAGGQDYAQRLFDSWQAKEYEGVYMMLCEHYPPFFKSKMPPKKALRSWLRA